MNAREYYKIWITKIKMKCKTERDYIRFLMRDDLEIIFAEAFHKAEIESLIKKLKKNLILHKYFKDDSFDVHEKFTYMIDEKEFLKLLGK